MTSDERYNAMLLSELNFEGFGSFHSVSMKHLENIESVIKRQFVSLIATFNFSFMYRELKSIIY